VSDKDLERNVAEELSWDPKIDERPIAVAADDGVVTLRGTVGNFRQKLEAKHAAQRVNGVKRVENDLQVKLLTGSKKEAAELRADVLQALMLNSTVPETVDVRVEGGYVTLTGSAEWQYQREEAVQVAANVHDVLGVFDQIELVDPKPDVGDVKHSIKSAFERNAGIEADDIQVTAANGAVTLEGVVSSWAEHDAAIGSAWAAPGVKNVHDHLEVLSE
jgi:osmotically-inducible protein OsmY